MALGWTNTQRSTGPGGGGGGVKIKMTLGFATPRESYRLLVKYKTKVGPCWTSFIQGKMSRGSHNPNRVRDTKSRNIIPV